MIQRFIAIEARNGGLRICFIDDQDRSWFVGLPDRPNVGQLAQALQAADVIASDPEMAVKLGLIQQADLDFANEKRDKDMAKQFDPKAPKKTEWKM